MEQKTRFPGLIGPSNKQRSQRFDNQRTVNMYVELSPLGAGKGQEPGLLLSRPGLRKVADLTNAPVRGLYATTDGSMMVAVAGAVMYYTTDNWATSTIIGLINTSSGPVQFADNGSAVTDSKVMVIDGQYGYTFSISDPVSTFTGIASANFYPADSISFQDGYFILNRKDTGYYFISDLNDVTFSALNEALKSGYGDKIKAVISNNRELYLLGEKTIEYWWNTGASGYTPFQRIDGKFANVGCAAADSVKKLGNTVFFVGSNEQGSIIVYQMDGDVPSRISTNAVEFSIQATTDPSNIRAFAYQQEGHYFYCINVPGIDTTWCYDMTTKMWTERQSMVNGNLGQHFVNTAVTSNGNIYLGSSVTGAVYVYDFSYYLDDVAPILRLRQTPHQSDNLNNQFVTLLQVDCQPGVGNQTGFTNETTPRLILEVSRDGGLTFAPPRVAYLGKIGKYLTRQRWTRLGYGRDLVYRITCTDPVNFVLLSAFVQTEVGYA